MRDQIDIAKDLTDLLRDVVGAAVSDASELRFDGSHKWHFALVSIYLSMIEYCKSAHTLAVAGEGIAIPTLLRSVFEAHVDLKNLVADRSYGYKMDVANATEWLKVQKAAKAGNPYLSSIGALPNIDSLISETEHQISELRKKGHTTLKQHEKFAKAGFTEEYASVYNFLCCASHNNMRALVSRHFSLDEVNDKAEIKLFVPFEEGHNVSSIDMLIALLIQGSALVYEALQSSFAPKVPALISRLQEVRNNY